MLSWPPPRPPILSLALEEALAEKCRNTMALVWTSWPAVVAGRTSKPPDYDCTATMKAGIPVYRRRSGGGAVVLGPGVLAFTLLLPGWPRPKPPTPYGARMVAEALGMLGLDSWVENEGDIVVGSPRGAFKVGGSAAYVSRDTAVYHATIIVDEPTERMYTLTPPRYDRVVKGEVSPVKYRPASLWDLHGVGRRRVLEAIEERMGQVGIGLGWLYTLARECPGTVDRALNIVESRYRDPSWAPCGPAEDLAGFTS